MNQQYPALAGLRILVVEDQLLNAMLIERMLDKLNCETVGPVHSIEEATTAIQEQRLDGVLLDVNLRGKSSVPAIKELIGRGVPFIVVSGYGPRMEDPPALKTAPRLMKPFAFVQLANRMVEVFADASGEAGRRT